MKVQRIGTYKTGFKYYNKNKEITNNETINKIKELKIPPAYDNVTIINGGKIIASGCNTHKSYSNDCFIKDQCSCHAEINVLRKIYNNYKHKDRKLKKVMKNTTLYVSRCSSQGKSTNSAPCMKCLKTIKSFNIKKIIFVLNDEYHIYKTTDYFTDHKTFGDKNLDLIK